ncbi:phospholipase B1, membrane-associated [Ditylenchus destructor]|uniref:Phospholipase B1, membrane-associated n=1 Tax=Ditylenchus destructor TaxID=166010 RepID=A0AAD4NDI4_9BILA|nr:phospholipase B1, membrane-associated [Ditylenchus destructor]
MNTSLLVIAIFLVASFVGFQTASDSLSESEIFSWPQTAKRSLPNYEEEKPKNVIVVQAKRRNQAQELVDQNATNESISDSSSDAIAQDRSQSDDDDDDQTDLGDSDVSEERNPEDLINNQLSPVGLDAEQKRPDDIVSVINNAFNNRKSFSCPKIKDDFLTGTSTANLSPEDIGIIGAMGDSLATGTGLWPKTGIAFRGAAFPIGGDATIDGLVTVPNILREFTVHNTLVGVSHGMGDKEQLPKHQLNVAESGATTSSMPDQAVELVHRIQHLKEVDIYNNWAMIIITVGTEEVCGNCTGPDTQALIEALNILNRGIRKAFVVLLGPIHVSSSYHQKANLLKSRCECSRNKSDEFMIHLSEEWKSAFEEIHEHMEDTKRRTFNVLALPMLTITSRYPYSLFIPNKPLLNRRGHNYAAKWLWNRLIGGPKYNLSNAILSQDAYFCPSLGCPYFRNTDNYNYCKIQSHTDAEMEARLARELALEKQMGKTKFQIYTSALFIVSIAFLAVVVLGTTFYQRSKKGSKGRFDHIPVANEVYRHKSFRERKSSVTGSMSESPLHSSESPS